MDVSLVPLVKKYKQIPVNWNIKLVLSAAEYTVNELNQPQTGCKKVDVDSTN